MRKKIISPSQQKANSSDHIWLDLETLADVEISSEDTDHPIEAALITGGVSGWRAAEPGQQTIRLLFRHPQNLQLIRLSFVEANIERTQEYVLRWSADNGKSYREIVQQQWNFNPEGSTNEMEDYQVNLSAVTTLELNINPDISGNNTVASLELLRIA